MIRAIFILRAVRTYLLHREGRRPLGHLQFLLAQIHGNPAWLCETISNCAPNLLAK